MEKIYNFAIVGCGWIGESKHVEGIGRLPDGKVYALCDIDLAKAESLNERYGLGAKVYQDYKEMVQDPEIDIVHVCTPNPTHTEIAVAALRAGKHVLVEKPFACTKAECDLMIEEAKKAGKKLTVGFNWRLRPQTMMLKEMAKNGEFGEIYYAKAHSIRFRDVPTWGEFITGNNGGGIIIDGAPHSLDLVMWIMDNHEPKSVKAVAYDLMKDQPAGNTWGPWDPDKFKVEDTGFALITMKNGATIYLEANWTGNMISGDNKCTIVGTKKGADMFGSQDLRIIGVEHGKKYITEPDFRESPAPFALHEIPCEYKEARVWLDAIKNDTEVFVKPEEAAVVSQLLEGIYESIRTGKEVFFD